MDIAPDLNYRWGMRTRRLVDLYLPRIMILCGFFLVIPFAGMADESPELQLPGWYNPCPVLPADAVAIQVRTEPIVVSGGYFGEGEYDRQIIENETEYEDSFDTLDFDIDWAQFRGVIVEEYEVYQRNNLEREYRLTGVYLTDESIIIRQTFRNYAPCQGIAQELDPIAIGGTYFLLLVPREPEQIIFSSCRIGDCPPDIP